jgi:hypothetical protein
MAERYARVSRWATRGPDWGRMAARCCVDSRCHVVTWSGRQDTPESGLSVDALWANWAPSWFRSILGGQGLWAAVAVAAMFGVRWVWWNWSDIARRPGVRPLVQRFGRKRLRVVPPGLTVALAHLDDDPDRQHEKLLSDELRHYEGISVHPLDRIVTMPAGNSEDARLKATDRARELLRRTGADVLLWGSVVQLGGKSAMRLYWTTAGEVPGAKATEKYATETTALPALFWDDLKQVMGLLATTRLSSLATDSGRYVADKLAPMLEKVRLLLQNQKGNWNPETQAAVQFALAMAFEVKGSQSGDSDALAASIGLYRQVLVAWTRERVPLDWAMTQNNLGTALSALGEREAGTARLEEAVTAYRDTLKEHTRERVPLNWAPSVAGSLEHVQADRHCGRPRSVPPAGDEAVLGLWRRQRGRRGAPPKISFFPGFSLRFTLTAPRNIVIRGSCKPRPPRSVSARLSASSSAGCARRWPSGSPPTEPPDRSSF